MDEIKRAILEEIRAYSLWIGELQGQMGGYRIPDWFVHGMPYRPAEIANRSLSGAERKAFQRALESLAADELVVRVASGVGRKTTHLRPEPSLVRTWLVESDDSTGRQIITALNRTNGWGQRILGEVVG